MIGMHFDIRQVPFPLCYLLGEGQISTFVLILQPQPQIDFLPLRNEGIPFTSNEGHITEMLILFIESRRNFGSRTTRGSLGKNAFERHSCIM